MEARNIPYILSYIAELLLLFLGAVFYRQPLLSVLLLLFIMLPFLSIALTKYEMKKLSLRMDCDAESMVRGDTLSLRLTADHRGIVPLLNCRLSFVFENRYYPHPLPRELTFPAESRRRGEIILPFTVSAAGLFALRTKQLFVTDFLHFYTFSRPFSREIFVPVLPKDVPATALSKNPAGLSEEDRDRLPEEVPSSAGEPSRDVRQLHEYRAGDRVGDIHWKLTAKTGTVLVKEYERQKEMRTVLLPVLTKEAVTPHGAGEEDALQKNLAVFYALSKALLKENEPFLAALFDGETGFSLEPVTDEESLFTMLYHLYERPLSDTAAGVKAAWEAQGFGAAGTVVIEDGNVTAM